MKLVSTQRFRRVLKLSFWCFVVSIILGFLTLYILDYFFPFPKNLLEDSKYSLQIYDCNDKVLMSFLNSQGQWYFPVTLSDVSPIMQKAMVSAEDKNFYRHYGVDLWALGRAFIGNITKLWVYSGASTITMQAIRLMEPRKRTIKSKIIESFRAWQLERIYSKEQILEYYFNHTPYGGNLIGIEAAARSYFDKNAKDLTLGESSLLAGLPQSPSRYRPDRHLQKALVRRNYTLRRMKEDGYITSDQEEAVRQQTPIISRFSRQLSAAHWCFMLNEQYPKEKKLVTTLDWNIQQIAQRHLLDGLAKYSLSDISNGAVLIMDNRNHNLVAWIGSADFFSSNIQGQINGVKSLRAAGSLLKPFTYCLAFDKGFTTPNTILYDLEFIAPNYRPNNYDRLFRGPISARSALRESLNIPAIRLQQSLTTEKLLECYRNLGLKSLNQSPEYYGLTLTLGTAENSLLELVAAYSALANNGKYFSPRFLISDPISPSVQVFSEEACYLIHDILKDIQPLSDASIYIPSNVPAFAWKTGTSSGNRDAWTILYNPDYTIGVWLGNFNNQSSKNLVGIEVSAPIACRIFADLAQSKKINSWYIVPKGLEKRQICPVSGDIFHPGICPNFIEDWAIKNISPEFSCRIHVLAQICNENHWVVCPKCAKDFSKVTTKVCQKWPSYVNQWLLQNGGGFNLLPRHNPSCNHQNQVVTIVKPSNNSQFSILEGEKQQIELQAFSSNSQILYWFENGTLIKSSSSGELFLYTLKKGIFELVCCDELGYQSKIKIIVK